MPGLPCKQLAAAVHRHTRTSIFHSRTPYTTSSKQTLMELGNNTLIVSTTLARDISNVCIPTLNQSDHYISVQHSGTQVTMLSALPCRKRLDKYFRTLQARNGCRRMTRAAAKSAGLISDFHVVVQRSHNLVPSTYVSCLVLLLCWCIIGGDE